MTAPEGFRVPDGMPPAPLEIVTPEEYLRRTQEARRVVDQGSDVCWCVEAAKAELGVIPNGIRLALRSDSRMEAEDLERTLRALRNAEDWIRRARAKARALPTNRPLRKRA